jgi:hypothetical protein
MRSYLYGEQIGQSQAARGSANGLTAILGGCKFSGDRADMEGKSCDGHEVGSLVGESDRGYAQGGKAEEGAAGGDIGELIRLFCLPIRTKP